MHLRQQDVHIWTAGHEVSIEELASDKGILIKGTKMKYEILKRDNSGESIIMDGDCRTCEDALEEFVDCVLDHGQDDSWLMEDYLRIRQGHNAIKFRKLLGWLEKNGYVDETFLRPRKDKPYELVLKVSGEEKEQYEDDLFAESWNPSFYDKP